MRVAVVIQIRKLSKCHMMCSSTCLHRLQVISATGAYGTGKAHRAARLASGELFYFLHGRNARAKQKRPGVLVHASLLYQTHLSITTPSSCCPEACSAAPALEPPTPAAGRSTTSVRAQ